jgi:4-amino-4-deoxy-L-arabinose transferase-like glycosyltransferase
VAIVAVGAVLRIAWAVTQAENPKGLHDPGLYMVLADQVANGHGYSYPGVDGGVTAYYPPGYPLLLAALMWGIGLLPGDVAAFDVALWANVLLSVATIPLVFALGRRLASPVVGLVAAAAFAVWPNLVIHSGVILTETLFLFLLVSMFLVALATPEVARRPGWRRLATVGVLFGLAGLVRPVSLVIAPLFLLLWWSDGVARAVRYTAIVGLATVAVIVPWTIRNVVQMDSPVLLSANFGDNFCVGNNPEATGGYGLPEYCFRGLDSGERPEFETHRQSVTLDRGLTWLTEHPLDAAGLVPDRLRTTLAHDDDGVFAALDYGDNPTLSESTSDTLGTISDVLYYAVVVLALAGVVVLVRRGGWADRRWQVFVLSAPVGLVSPILTFGDPRFKMPMYPVLAVCAGLALAALLDRRSAEAAQPPAPAEEPEPELAASEPKP